MAEQTIPHGYLKNQNGHLVPQESIDEIDLTRNDLVLEMVAKAQTMRGQLATFKQSVMGDMAAFIEMSAEKYGIQVGGNKGNVTLLSYDGQYKVQRAIAEHLVFDERLQVAKELIDQCIHSWAESSHANVRALIEHAFQVDKQGKISTGRVLGLRQLNIEDKDWKQAMEAIADSIKVSSTKAYLRFYQRIGEDSWQPISLDIAAL